jgi:hypothetical protein
MTKLKNAVFLKNALGVDFEGSKAKSIEIAEILTRKNIPHHLCAAEGEIYIEGRKAVAALIEAGFEVQKRVEEY